MHRHKQGRLSGLSTFYVFSVCLSVSDSPSLCACLCVSFSLSLCFSISHLCLSVSVFLCLCLSVSLCVSLCLFVSLFLYLTSLSLCLSVSVCLSCLLSLSCCLCLGLSISAHAHRILPPTPVMDTSGGRLLCAADLESRISRLYRLAQCVHRQPAATSASKFILKRNRATCEGQGVLRKLPSFWTPALCGSPFLPSGREGGIASNSCPPALGFARSRCSAWQLLECAVGSRGGSGCPRSQHTCASPPVPDRAGHGFLAPADPGHRGQVSLLLGQG